MQLLAVRKGECGAGDILIDRAHCLRAQVFEGRLEWAVTTINGREYDAYDELDPTYLLVTDPTRDRVIGCSRLLPGDGPTMLGRTFPQLLDGKPMPYGRQFVESSRFCVDTASAPTSPGSRESVRGVHQATMMLFAGILEWSLAEGYSKVITVTDLRLERIFSRAGLPFERLGQPRPIGNTVAVAGTIPVTLENALRVRPVGYRSLLPVRQELAA